MSTHNPFFGLDEDDLPEIRTIDRQTGAVRYFWKIGADHWKDALLQNLLAGVVTKIPATDAEPVEPTEEAAIAA
jgi:hypothetical protein